MNKTMMVAEFAEGRPVEVLRTGAFTDMHGTKVVVDVDLLDALVEHFEAGDAGQDVPIDVNHEKAESAGWVTRLYREGERLLATVDWNSLGEQLVGDKVYKYVSAFFDLGRKVLKSISLVNFPAVKGLAAVELSEGVFAFKEIPVREVLRARMHAQFVGTVDGLVDEGVLEADRRQAALEAVEAAVDAFYQALEGLEATVYRPDEGVMYLSSQDQEGRMSEQEMRDQIRAEIEAELAEQRKTEAQLREQILSEIRPQVEAELARHQELVAFAEEVCSGDVALATPPEQVVEFLEALPAEQVEAAQAILRAKTVELRERGSSNAGQETQLVELDPGFAASLRKWVDGGGDLAEWFRVNKGELGEMSQYNLEAFQG